MSELVLVTGGAGFIGSHLVEALTAAGKKVRILDNFSTGLRSNLETIKPAPEIIDDDLSDADAVTRAVQGAGVVFHLGALASVQRSVDDPLATNRVCVNGTVHVLDAARRHGVRRVVYAASSSAYGGVTGTIQKESDPVHTLSPYAAAKVAGEFYASAFAATYGLETVCLRFFNIFGPRQREDSPYSGVIALFSAAMAADRQPTVHGDGLQSRDFTFVTNAVQGLIKASTASNVSGKVFNIGTGRSITLLELVAALNRLLGKNLAVIHGSPRAGDVRHSRADISRARQELGYEPAVDFEKGLEETLRWYRERN